MARYAGKWRIGLYLNERLEILCATVDVRDELGIREVVKAMTGPFDSPDDILSMLIELLEAAEWRGEQLRLPGTTGEQEIYDRCHECPATDLDEEGLPPGWVNHHWEPVARPREGRSRRADHPNPGVGTH